MILVTGGAGFVGSHTVRALLDLGESCVLVQRRDPGLPPLIADASGARVRVERADLADLPALLEVGERHPISGIVHLASPGIGAADTIAALRANTDVLLNVLEAATRWKVPRVGVASTIGIYLGVDDEVRREEIPLPMTGTHPVETYKKNAELLSSFVAAQAGFEVVNLRIGGVWGPLGRPSSPFMIAPQLVHAAVRGTDPGLTAYAEDGIDLVYAKDAGRGIALLQTADRLAHRTYNVSSGRTTTNRELLAAVRKAVPGVKADLAEGHDPRGPGRDQWLDITRIRQDTGYGPEYDTERGVADYVEWLAAGNER
jgi:UDP-glucose 4-epimerase